MYTVGLSVIKWQGTEYEDPGLPPPQFRLLDHRKDKIETPLDDMGLVAVPALIRAVKATISPRYTWAKPCDVHHFQWPGSNYPYYPGHDGVNADTFRELPIHKGAVPRSFHNWLHAITIPPPAPDAEVMQYRIEAWNVASALFHEVRDVVRWERRMRRRAHLLHQKPDVLPGGFAGVDLIGREVMADVLASNFKGMERHLARLDAIPEEHRLFEPTDSPSTLAFALGRLVAPRALLLTHQVAA